MGANEDLLLGRLVVKLGFATHDQVEACAKLQATRKQPLGLLLVEHRHLTWEQLNRAIEVQKRHLLEVDTGVKKRKLGSLFGTLVVREGLAMTEQVNECLAIQARPGEKRTLGEIMVERGILTSDQVRILLGKQHKKLMICPPCHLRFTVRSIKDRKNVPCPRCGRRLEEGTHTEPLHTDAELGSGVTQVIQSVVAPSTAPPREFTCIICDEVFHGHLDATGRVRCTKCKSNYTPKDSAP